MYKKIAGGPSMASAIQEYKENESISDLLENFQLVQQDMSYDEQKQQLEDVLTTHAANEKLILAIFDSNSINEEVKKEVIINNIEKFPKMFVYLLVEKYFSG